MDQLFARIFSTGTAAWYLTDRLGSVRDIIDNTGAVIDHLNYDGFGNVTSETEPWNGDRFKWTGRESDSETGLQYNRARYYDPKLGRWTSQDPMGLGAGDANLYRYAINDTPNATDPSGLYGPGPGLGYAAYEQALQQQMQQAAPAKQKDKERPEITPIYKGKDEAGNRFYVFRQGEAGKPDSFKYGYLIPKGEKRGIFIGKCIYNPAINHPVFFQDKNGAFSRIVWFNAEAKNFQSRNKYKQLLAKEMMGKPNDPDLIMKTIQKVLDHNHDLLTDKERRLILPNPKNITVYEWRPDAKKAEYWHPKEPEPVHPNPTEMKKPEDLFDQ